MSHLVENTINDDDSNFNTIQAEGKTFTEVMKIN